MEEEIASESEHEEESEIEDDEGESNQEERNQAQAKSVKNQLIVWDLLLNSRIKLQKLLLASNKLPQNATLTVFLDEGGQELKDAQDKAKKEEETLIKALLRLDEAMRLKSGLIPRVEKNQENEDSEDVDQDGRISKKLKIKGKKIPEVEEDSSEQLDERHIRLLSVANNVMDHWFQKTRYATRGGKLDRKHLEEDASIVKTIEQILANRERLIRKTRLRRSDYDILGKTDDENYESEEDNEGQDSRHDPLVQKVRKEPVDPEIYDDDDFYRQLLRQLIESKTSPNTVDPIALSRRWLQVQKLRSKMKKKIDTKASKGRKIRYQVHTPLISFMAPVDDGTYEDEAKDALFSSLFNKRKYLDN